MLGLPFLLFFFPLHLVSNTNTHSGRSTRAPVPRIFLRSATPIRTRRDSQAGPRLRCAGLGTYAEPVARIGGENSEAALHRGIHNTAARPGRLLWWLSSIRSNRDTEQRAPPGGGSLHSPGAPRMR